LITIGIIGIVAALTIPTLHTRIQKAVLKNQIKKVMSQVNQSYRLLKEEGYVCTEVASLSNDIQCRAYNSGFINNFKIARICKGNGLRDNCIPEYDGLNTAQSVCPLFSDNQVYNNQTIYVTLDGVIFIPYAMYLRSLWLVDVNGMKGPNKAGWDVFTITLDNGNDTNHSQDERPFWSSRYCTNQDNHIKGAINSYDITVKTIDNW
jgi:type II secretory pathway pseudopilin PulG